MYYQFEVTLRAPMTLPAATEEEAEEQANTLSGGLLDGSKLEVEYPDVDYRVREVKDGQALVVFGVDHFTIKVEQSSLTDAGSVYNNKTLDDAATEDQEHQLRELVKGCPFDDLKWEFDTTVDDEQPGLEELIGEMEGDYSDFAIMAEAGFYHIVCAEVVFGKAEVDLVRKLSGMYSEDTIISDNHLVANPNLLEAYPSDSEGNLLHVVTCHDFAHDVREAFPQPVVDTCECGNSLYDDPVPLSEGEQAKIEGNP